MDHTWEGGEGRGGEADGVCTKPELAEGKEAGGVCTTPERGGKAETGSPQIQPHHGVSTVCCR